MELARLRFRPGSSTRQQFFEVTLDSQFFLLTSRKCYGIIIQERKENMKNRKRLMKITKEQLFDFDKPKYNGFGCGHGAHKNKKKYNRKDKSWMNYV